MIVAVVPVKSPIRAKTRLGADLSQGEREGVTRAMLGDVLAALKASDRITATYVVAEDEALIPDGTSVILEPVNRGYDEAIAAALSDSRVSQADAILILPSDVPLVRPENIDELCESFDGTCVRIAPDRGNGGTNGLLIQPPHLMATSFGSGSFERHLAAAREIADRVEILTLPGLALDIDTPQDLMEFLGSDAKTQTRTYLKQSGIARRLLNTPG
ncbi:MAG: 2-phospho-L-lactate guanylyltransferase [Rhodospirillaceae bacterium]|jgi:2-phospho-L-lactate/phosphoenolpyruvate guanylyltransferase|nr:2-phospho-L-lactate guanylyltransferase [Rhodospirillaceae bacterium]